MAGCCDPRGYRMVFSEREARRAVRRFERKGLDATARLMVDALSKRGIEGATVLEVGAGSGTAQVALLEAGAQRSTAYDISPSYERVAGALLAGRGLTDRVDWHTGDFTAAADAPEAAVVFANRVVCCYPEMEPLVDAATSRSRRLLALAYPRDRLRVRFGVKVVNLFLRMRKVPFRVFVHDPDSIAARVEAAGLLPVAGGETAVWHWRVWERAA